MFEGLVRTWSKRINLVSTRDLDKLWERHILDSAQLVDLTATPRNWMDLGSGGGFPGVVVGILLESLNPSARVTLIESDQRKSAFLRTAIKALQLSVDVHAKRINAVAPSDATTISARALAPLQQLVDFANRHLASGGTALFPKGRSWKNELVEAKEKWSFDCDVIRSVTDAEAVILRLQGIHRL